MADELAPVDVRGTSVLGTAGASLYNALAWFAQQANYNSISAYYGNSPTVLAPVEDPELEEVVVHGTAVPESELTDQELAEKWGGGDSAYQDVWDLRHPGEVGSSTGPLEPSIEASDDAFVWPTVVFNPVVPRIVTTILGSVLAPIVGLLVPIAEGDKDLDEAPAPGGRRGPPPRPREYPLDPINPPNWEDLSKPDQRFWDDLPGKPVGGPVPEIPLEWTDPDFEMSFEDFLRFTGTRPVGGTVPDRVGRVLPIGDTPGVFDTPFEFQNFPIEVPRPGTVPLPRTDWPSTFPYGDPFAPFIAEPFPTPRPQPIPEIRPGPAPGPGLQPNPFPDPIGDPFRFPVPGPRADPAPDRVPDPFFDPLPDPFSLPTPGNPTTPGVPLSPLLPDLFGPFEPEMPNFPNLFETPQPFLTPPGNNADPCNCADTKKKKKKKKPKPRNVCYRGTYRELRNGTSKTRLEEIPCEAAAPKSSKRKPKVPTTLDWRTVFGDPLRS